MAISTAICRVYDEIIDRCKTDNIEELGRTVPIPFFDECYLHSFLCDEAIPFFATAPPIMNVPSGVVIVGDINGNLHNIVKIFKEFGKPSESRYLFLGNFIDYGEFSLETATILLAYALKYPTSFFLLRGINESFNLSIFHGLSLDVENSYKRQDILDDFFNVFSIMSFGSMIGGCVFACQPTTIASCNSVLEAQNLPKKANIMKGTDGYLEYASVQKLMNDEIVANFVANSNIDCLICGSCDDGCIMAYAGAIGVTLSACEQDGTNCVMPMIVGEEVDQFYFESSNQVQRKKAIFHHAVIELKEPKNIGHKKNYKLIIPKIESHPLLTMLQQKPNGPILQYNSNVSFKNRKKIDL